MSQPLLVDGHNDLAWALRKNHESRVFSGPDLNGRVQGLHTDIPRHREGGMGAQFWSVYVPHGRGCLPVQQTLEQIDIVYRIVNKYAHTYQFAFSAEDVMACYREQKIASLMGMEGGHQINNSLSVLRMMYTLGVRYMTLTHNGHNDWADCAMDQHGKESTPIHNGLNSFGQRVVREMNRIGMMVDLSHVHELTMHAALDVSTAPVIFSHSSARGVRSHHRNVPDSVLTRLRENGGVCMVTFVSSFVSEECKQHRQQQGQKEIPASYLGQVADHIDRICKVAGPDHCGIGGDFDGTPTLPVGLEDVSTYNNLKNELQKRGYTQEDINKIWGLNLVRVMKDVEAVSKRTIHMYPDEDKNGLPASAL